MFYMQKSAPKAMILLQLTSGLIYFQHTRCLFLLHVLTKISRSTYNNNNNKNNNNNNNIASITILMKFYFKEQKKASN